MKCPLCNTKSLVDDVRPKTGGVVCRKYECIKCNINFETTEKINYEKLPRKVLDRLHEKAERSR